MKKNVITLILLLASGNVLFAGLNNENHRDPNMAQVEQFVEMMQKYVNLADGWVGAVRQTEGAAFFAIESIVEIHGMQGNKLNAIPVLRDYANDSGQSDVVRRIALFKIMDIYKETGKYKEALSELDKILNSLKSSR